MNITKPGIPLLLSLVLAAAPTLPQILRPPASGGLERSGRWFTYNGQPTYLVGLDIQDPACNPHHEYRDQLDQYRAYRINSVRVFVYCYWAADPSTNYANTRGYLFPWAYANGKFDLDVWNDTFWARLRDYVAQAKAREIMVEVTIIPSNVVGNSDWWPGLAWNKDKNVNGAFSVNDAGHFSPQFFDLTLPEVSTSDRRLKDYQQALIDKTIAELGSFDNVYFEVSNEFPGRFGIVESVYAWQQTWARWIHRLTPRLVSVHAQEYYGDNTTGIQHLWDQPYVDVLNFHFGPHGTPEEIANLLHAAQLKNKILTNNESLEFDGDTDYAGIHYDLASQMRFAWGMLLAGGYFNLESGYVRLFEDHPGHVVNDDPHWIAGAQRLKALRDIAEVAHFWEMSPVDRAGNEYDALISQGPSDIHRRLMANPGSRYLAYFWGSKSSASVEIALPAGSYSYTWYDPRNGTVIGSGSVSGGGTATIPAPSTTSWDENLGLALLIQSPS